MLQVREPEAARLSQPLESFPPQSSASAADGCSNTPANPAASATTPASAFVRRDFRDFAPMNIPLEE